jgi:hypothetical protein
MSRKIELTQNLFLWGYGISVMVFNATFNNISAISCRSMLLVEEIGVHEKSTDLLQVTDKFLSHIVVSSTTRHERNSNS